MSEEALKLLLSRIIEASGPMETPCWIYTGPENGQYGGVNCNNKRYRAHRLAYETWIGPIGELYVLHKCDIPKCCNPKHLFLGTYQDNSDDKVAKGRDIACTGEQNGRANITEETAREIKRMLADGFRPIVIQQKLNVTKHTIFNIKRGRVWRHL